MEEFTEKDVARLQSKAAKTGKGSTLAKIAQSTVAKRSGKK